MIYCKIGCFAFVCCLILYGCRQQEKRDFQFEAAMSRIANMRDNLNAGHPSFSDVFEATAKIGGWIAAVTNVSRRTELALELSKALLSVDLTNQPYLVVGPDGRGHEQRLSAVDSYFDHMLAAFRIMTENECPPETAMDFFFNAFQKYKDASFSVPFESYPLPGESRRMCDSRGNTAHKSYDFYSYHMVFIRRTVLPYLSNYLPHELHAEFNRRIEPFFDFPSKAEFYEMMHPRFKYAPPKPLEQKQTPKGLNDEIEVDI